MIRNRSCMNVALTALTILCLALTSPAAGQSCGDTITVDTTLTADLLNCPGTGLIIGASGITLDGAGYTIEYNSSGADDNVGILINGYSNVTIKNCVLVDVNGGGENGHGIFFTGAISHNNQVLGNTIRTNGTNSYGVLFFFSSVGSFDSNTVRGNQISSEIGVYFVGGNNNLIEDNIIQTASGGFGNNFGVFVQTFSTLVATGNTIRNNVITTGGPGSLNIGIRIDGAATSGTMVVGNIISTNGGGQLNHGIMLRGLTHNNNVENNTIVTGGAGFNNEGIFMDFTSGNTITGNNIQTGGQTGRGFHLTFSENNTISGNTIDTGSLGGRGAGLFVRSKSDNNIISDNVIATNGPGIQLDDVVGTDVSGNTIHTNPGDGIFLNDSANNNTIQENTINTSGLFGVGLQILASTGNAVFHNNFLSTVGVKAHSDAAIELSFNSEGNFWGRTCADNGGFLPGIDSNATNVVDSFPFGVQDHWEFGGMPCPDSDGDGVNDADDACPDSDLRDNIVIDGIDTGVENVLQDDGCTLSDLIDAVLAADPSIVDVVQFIVVLRAQGIITGRDLGAILKALKSQPICGDGTVDPNEECDDGNNIDGDGCSANCTIEERCPDGTVPPCDF